jgi:PKD repeat protein
MQLKTILLLLITTLVCNYAYAQNRGCIPVPSNIYLPAGDTFCINVNGYLLGANPAGGVFVGSAVSGNMIIADAEGTYTVIYYPSDNCFLPDTLVYTIKGPPDTPAVPLGISQQCPDGPNSTFFVNPVSGADNYTWSVSPLNVGMIVDDGNGSITIDWDPNFCGEVSISAVAVNECGTSLPSVVLTVTITCAQPPVISGTGPFCVTQSAFQLQSSIPNTTWSSNCNNVTSTGVITPTTAATCFVTADAVNNGCPVFATASITINPALDVNANTASAPIVCVGGLPIALVGSPQGGSFNPSSTINPDVPGISVFTYIIAGQNGCSGSDTDTITVLADPIANFSYYFDGCNKVCFVDSSVNAETWFWEFGDGQTSPALNNCHVFSDTGTYCVSLWVTNACGTADTTICIDITCVGLDENVVDQLSLYPNPTNGLVNVFFNSVKAHNYMLNVVDVTGKVLYTENLNNFVGQYNNPIDFSRFAAGMYIFRVVAEDGPATNVKVVRN